MPLSAQRNSGLVDRLAQWSSSRRGLAPNSKTVVVRPVLLQVNGHGDQHVVVGALPQRLAFLLSDTDHLVGPTVNADLLAQRVGPTQQMLDDVGTHDCHLQVIIQVRIVQHSPVRQIRVEDGRNRRRNPLDSRIADGLFVVLHFSAAARHRAHILAVAAGLQHGLVVFQLQVLAFLCHQKVLDIGLDRRHLGNNEDVGAKIENLGRHVVLNPRHKCHDRDDRRDANHHAQQREDRAQLVGPQGPQRDSDGFCDVHEVGFSLAASCLRGNAVLTVRVKFIRRQAGYSYRNDSIGSKFAAFHAG